MTTPIFTRRLAALQGMLAAKGVDLAVFTYNTDILYYAGSIQPLYLCVPAVGEAFLLTRKAATRIRDEVRHLPLFEFTGTKELRAILTTRGVAQIGTLGMTLDTAAFATVERMRELFGGPTLVDLAWEMRTLRMVKEPGEIDTFRRAAAVMAQLPAWVRAHMRTGISELEFSAALEFEMRRRGHGSLVRCRREGVEMAAFGVCSGGVNTLAGTKFDGICGGVGLSAAAPFGAAATPIAPGVPFVLDFAFVLDGYHLDQTRMACLGQPAPEVTRAYDAMVRIEEAIFAALRPGVLWETIYTDAVALAETLGYADTFMGVGSERVRFVGHGVGSELDEPPFLAPKMSFPLEAGMTLAIEPKVALPGIGVVGIEDTVLITDTGMERITTCAPEIIVV
jgi:Xaa-Pro aminopeptidase